MPGAMPNPARTARVLHAALSAGLLVITTVLVVAPRPVALPERALVYAAFFVGALGFAAALVMQNRIPREPHDEDAWWRANLPLALGVWSMLEGPAILGAVIHYVTGRSALLLLPATGLLLLTLTAPGRLHES